jgi:hypothetical protein
MVPLTLHVATYEFILIVMTPNNNIPVTTDVREKAMLAGRKCWRPKTTDRPVRFKYWWI